MGIISRIRAYLKKRREDRIEALRIEYKRCEDTIKQCQLENSGMMADFGSSRYPFSMPDFRKMMEDNDRIMDSLSCRQSEIEEELERIGG